MIRVRKKPFIPLSPLPYPLLQRLGQRFHGAGGFLAKLFPGLGVELQQADMDLEPEEYVSMGLVTAIFHFVFWSAILTIVIGIARSRGIIAADSNFSLLVGPALAFVFAILVLVQVSLYPQVIIRKKVRDLERNLIFGLRTITVQIRSGVTLFEALSLVADGNYGSLSAEFRKVVDEINTGMADEDALQRSVVRNPSLFYRRAVWQIVNGMKAGADITNVLTELVKSMSKEQVIQIKKYGASLRLLSLIYMMLGVIIPALGLTFMIILSTFPQIPISETVLWVFLGFLILAQIMFVGLLKNKRPSLMNE